MAKNAEMENATSAAGDGRQIKGAGGNVTALR